MKPGCLIGLLRAGALAGSVLATVTAGAQDHAPATVRLEAEYLSLNATDMPLVRLLTELSRSGGVVFTIQGDPSRIRVSDSFEDLELARALGRILSAHSHLLVDRGTVDTPRHIDVILLGTGPAQPARRIQTVGAIEETAEPFEEPVDLALERALSSAPAAERAAAVDAIAYRSGDGTDDGYAGQVLVQMLADPDAALRARAVEALKDTADKMPFSALAQVAREDASAAIRMQALELLVERSENSESREPLRIALNDPDAAVQRRARELMLDWNVGSSE